MSKKNGSGTKKPKEPVAIVKCLCGCNQNAAPKRMFKQGHDAKLRHKAVATLEGKEKHDFTEEQLAFLKSAKYLTRDGASKLA